MSTTADIDIPLIVVGAGAAGMMAALVAAGRGTEVLLLEKSVHRGTNTQLSGGLLQAAGTRFQKELGIEDTWELMAADIIEANGGECDTALVEAVCRRSADYVHFLADTVGLDLHLDATAQWGHSRLRMHTNPDAQGATLIRALREAIAGNELITFVDEAVITGLLVEDGRVRGVSRETGSGVEEFRSLAVILACGGFGANRELLAQHCPEALDAVYIGSDTMTGDGIALASEAGADLAWMGSWQGHAHVNEAHGSHLSGAVPYLGGIMVDRSSRRFSCEEKGYSELSVELLQQPERFVVEIFDQRIATALEGNGVQQEAVHAGAVKGPIELPDLAAAFGLDLTALTEELDRYNAAARGEAEDPQGRTKYLAELTAPFYGARITGGLCHTQGGLRIDETGAVLTKDGSPIPGLLAAGGAAAGISGSNFRGYTSGNGLAHAFSTGLICAETAARQIDAVAV